MQGWIKTTGVFSKGFAKKRVNKKKKEPREYPVKKRQFHALLNKASQPIKKSDSKSRGTSKSHPSDDCNEKHTH